MPDVDEIIDGLRENPYRPDPGAGLILPHEPHVTAEDAWDEGFAAGRAAATPDPPDGDKRVGVTCFDPVTGESETQPLDPDNYILTLGERCEITACQVYANGTVQLTIKRGADREAPDPDHTSTGGKARFPNGGTPEAPHGDRPAHEPGGHE